ncbi:MAG: PEP-CTERM sorting domain-containing protein [Phycisphaerales bacterium]|nr:PEP-CTERM sorting domain-containing protein [Phycisphaerales bacterium]
MKNILIATGICGLLTMNTAADIIHDTTGFDINTTWLVGQSQATQTINQPADSIIVNGGDFFLESITVRLSATQLVGAVGGDYRVHFWSNDVDKPGTLLESFTIENSANLDGGDITMFSGGGVLLEQGSVYWVSAALPDDMSFGSWQGVDATSNGRAVAFSGSDDPNWISTSSTSSLYLQVTGTPVPTPGTLALLGLSVLAIRRR